VKKEMLNSILDGNDDEFLLYAVYRQIQNPANEPQWYFKTAYDASALVNSDGFRKLAEQSTSFEVYARAFEKLGMPEIASILRRVAALLSEDVDSIEDDRFQTIENELDLLFSEFFELSANSDRVFGEYIRSHMAEFTQ